MTALQGLRRSWAGTEQTSLRLVGAGSLVLAGILLAACSSSGGGAKTSPPAGTLTQKLAASGLSVTATIIYNDKTDPNHMIGRQGGYTSKTAWVDRAIAKQAGDPSSDPGGTQYGGSIEVYSDGSGAKDRLTELRAFKPPLGDGYDYMSGTAVLRLSYFLTPAQASKYKQAFATAVGVA